MFKNTCHSLLAFVIFTCGTPTFALANESKEINLSDLGFNKSQVQLDPSLDGILKEREAKLKEHQFWGLVSLATLVGTMVTAEEGNATPEHMVLGGMAWATYGASAYYAITAPDLPNGMNKSGGSLWHSRLAWVHGIGMFLAPIAGIMAKKQFDKGESLSGLGAEHKNVAGITAITMAISFALVSFEF